MPLESVVSKHKINFHLSKYYECRTEPPFGKHVNHDLDMKGHSYKGYNNHRKFTLHKFSRLVRLFPRS